MIKQTWVRVFLGLSAGLTLLFAGLFAFAPETGLEFTTHRPDQLVLVMAGRYLGLAVFAIGVLIWGDLKMAALFFGIGGMLGLIDGLIYLSAGYPHWKHTSVGLLGLMASGTTIWFGRVKENTA